MHIEKWCCAIAAFNGGDSYKVKMARNLHLFRRPFIIWSAHVLLYLKPTHRCDCRIILHSFLLSQLIQTFRVPSSTVIRCMCSAYQMCLPSTLSNQNHIISHHHRLLAKYYCRAHHDARNGVCAIPPTRWQSPSKCMRYVLRTIADWPTANVSRNQWPIHHHNTASKAKRPHFIRTTAAM